MDQQGRRSDLPMKNFLARAASAASPLWALALLVVQPVIFYWRVLINPSAHIPYDIETFHLPLAAYIARCIRQGVLPLWDPFPYCGVPIHADLQAQLFYPPAWIARRDSMTAGRFITED